MSPFAILVENPAVDLGYPVFGVWSSEVGLGSPFAMLVEDTGRSGGSRGGSAGNPLKFYVTSSRGDEPRTSSAFYFLT